VKEPNQTHEALTKEEREIYLEHHPAKTNSFDTRDLLTPWDWWRTSKFPHAGRRFPFRDPPLPEVDSLELSETFLAPYAVGVSTRKISALLEE